MTQARSGEQADTKAAERRWIPVSAQMHDHCMALAGVPADKFYWDARTFVETCQAVADYYDLDEFACMADVYNFEIEALGGRMVYSDSAMPTIDFRDTLIKEPEDLHRLKTPDFRKAGRIPFALDYMRLGKAKSGSYCGTFSMAVGMRTYPVLIKDMRKRPRFAHELFTFINDEVLIPYLKVQKEYSGISAATGVDAWASLPSLSVAEIRQWVLPYNQSLAKKAREFGVDVSPGGTLYNEEDPSKFDVKTAHEVFALQMEMRGGGNQLSLGGTNWHIHPLEPVRDFTAKYRSRGIEFTIDAGINARLSRDGPVDEIVSAVKRYVDAFGRDHKLGIRFGNIPADTPSDHVHAAVAAAHFYGKLPVAENLDQIDFKLPNRETFLEWKRAKGS